MPRRALPARTASRSEMSLLACRAARVALVSREIHPYVGGGIAPIVTETATLLSTVAEVALFTSARHRDVHVEAATETPYELVWVSEPEAGVGRVFSHMHQYSARVHHALRAHYGARGPDLIEFRDYLAEGFVTVQAIHTLAPWLEDTLVVVRLHHRRDRQRPQRPRARRLRHAGYL